MSFFESMYSDHIYLLLASDITALAKDKAYAQIHLDDMTVHQVNRSQDASHVSSMLSFKSKLSILQKLSFF